MSNDCLASKSKGADNRPLIERKYQSCHSGKSNSVGESLSRSSLTISLCELTLVSIDHRVTLPLHFAHGQPRHPPTDDNTVLNKRAWFELNRWYGKHRTTIYEECHHGGRAVAVLEGVRALPSYEKTM